MNKLSLGAVCISLFSFTTAAHAGCDFFEHNDRQGEKLSLHGGECAVLSRDNPDGCEGLKVHVVEGWNDMISSVSLNHNSVAVLKEHDLGEGEQITVARNSAGGSLGEFNDKASVVLCK